MSQKISLKIAYVILVHKNPQQFGQLIASLECDHAHFYVHVDKHSDISQFKKAIIGIDSQKITFLKRFDGRWGGFGIIKAEVHALRTIVQSKVDFDFILLLSGQDYPIKSSSYIFDFLSKNKEKSFVDYFPMPFAQWPNGGMDRIHRYHFKLFRENFAFPPYKEPKSLKMKVFYWVLSFFFKERKLPYGLKPFGGEHWWNFNMNTARHILKFMKEHPKYLSFHKYSFCADEMFFQTILLNSDDPKIVESLVNDDLRYYDWSEGKDSPKILSSIDFQEISKSQKLIARKFDPEVDQKVVELINEKLL